MSFPKEGITIKAQNKIIIENLKKAIDSSGRKKIWLAKQMGISYSSLWRQLNGSRKLKAETVAQIASLTGKSPNEIFEYVPIHEVAPLIKKKGDKKYE